MCTLRAHTQTWHGFLKGTCFLTINNTISFSFEITFFWEEIDDFYFQLHVYGCVRAHAHTRSHFGLSDFSLRAREHVFPQNGEKPPPPTLHILSWIQASRKWVSQRERGKKKKNSPRTRGPHNWLSMELLAPVYRIYIAEIFQSELNLNCV